MNELIEELFGQYARLFMNDKAEMLFTDFKQAIQTACKAQRHACTRIYHKHYGNSEHYDECCELEIFTAEIERCDYE